MLRILPIALAAIIASAPVIIASSSVASANEKVVILLCGASGTQNNVALCTASIAATALCDKKFGTPCAQEIETLTMAGLHLIAHSGTEYAPANFFELEYTFQN